LALDGVAFLHHGIHNLLHVRHAKYRIAQFWILELTRAKRGFAGTKLHLTHSATAVRIPPLELDDMSTEGWADIIQHAAASTLGLLALMCLIIGALTPLLLKDAPAWQRTGMLVLFFVAVCIFGYAAVFRASSEIQADENVRRLPEEDRTDQADRPLPPQNQSAPRQRSSSVSQLTGVRLPGQPEFLSEDPEEPLYLDLRSVCTDLARERRAAVTSVEVAGWMRASQAELEPISKYIEEGLEQRGFRRLSGHIIMNGHLINKFVERENQQHVIGYTVSWWTRNSDNRVMVWVWCAIR
jgi:hypothetical protein